MILLSGERHSSSDWVWDVKVLRLPNAGSGPDLSSQGRANVSERVFVNLRSGRAFFPSMCAVSREFSNSRLSPEAILVNPE